MASDHKTLDEQILAGEQVSAKPLRDALMSETPPTGELRIRYLKQLLSQALETRDPETMEYVADLMDTEPEVEEALGNELNEELSEQPDAVYAFVRAHLPTNQAPPWLSRLKIAALYSLRVAINDADTDTIVSWLTLVAREPIGYDLGDVLHYGILAAQARAHQDPELARQLVLLAAKRDPANLDVLLDDPQFVIALPDNVGLSLRDMNGDAMLLFQNRGSEIFLVVLARAAKAQAGAIFTPATIAKVWELYTTGQPVGLLPATYQPETIVQELVDHGIEFLKPDALGSLLAAILSSHQHDFLFNMFAQPDAPTILLPMLVPAMERAQLNINEALDLITRLVGADSILPQQAADLLINLLDGQEWSSEALPLMQQLARMTQQYTGITFTPEILWHLLNAAGEVKDEFIARMAVRRLLNTLEAVEDEVELTEMLRQMAVQTIWSDNVRQIMLNWWRGFTRQQPLNRLTRLERALDGRKGLDAERDILQTLLALRRMLGQRSLQEFASDVKSAFSILESLSESFDPNGKRQVAFDPFTIRDELNARDDQITPQERQVLASHLKEIAHLIAEMGDNRTKSNIIRRGDDLDRDLMSGEQAPHSAVDAMKWLAGYWGTTPEEET